MAATALIKITQGVLDPPAGEALIGTLTTPVAFSNADNSDVKIWTWTIIDVPPGSTVPKGVIATGNTATVQIVPDVRGGYHIELEVKDSSKRRSRIRTVFLVPEASGRKIPPFGATDRELNFGGSTRGWSPIMEDWLHHVDSGGGSLTEATLRSVAATLTASFDVNGQKITNSQVATTATGLTTKSQMESADAAILASANSFASSLLDGLDMKASVRCASPGTNINLSAPGASLDGVTFNLNDRFLAKDQTTHSSRGIYVWNGAAVPATRSTDADSSAEVTNGMSVWVSEGTTHARQRWTLITPDPIVLGTTSLDFTQTGGVVLATGNVIEIDLDFVQTSAVAYTSGKAREIEMDRYPVPFGFTRTLSFEGTLQSSVHAVITQVQLWDVTAGVQIGTTVTNSAEVDRSLPSLFRQTVSAGVINGTVRTDVDHMYEIRVSRSGGVATDLAKASGRLAILYS